MFKPISELNLSTVVGTELLLFNEEWIDEDFNPNGSRVGFLNGDENGEWLTCKWCAYHDEYHTEVAAPTHYMLIPQTPRNDGENHRQSTTSSPHTRADHHPRSGN